MSRAVQFDAYSGIDVLQVREIPRPAPAPGEVLVAVKAAGINPGEAMIRQGFLHDRWQATFPSGEGSNLAGVVAEGSAVDGRQRPPDVVASVFDRATDLLEQQWPSQNEVFHVRPFDL